MARQFLRFVSRRRLSQAALGIAGVSLMANLALAAFGSQVVVGSVRVHSIFRGASGPAYVTFTPANLPGCNGSAGGYLSSMWTEAGTPDPDAAKDQLALLALAKATDAPVEVRYRVNSVGTGWNRCAIDAIWVQ